MSSLAVGDWVETTADRLRLRDPEPLEGDTAAPDPAVTVYRCRETLVLTGIEPGTAP